MSLVVFTVCIGQHCVFQPPHGSVVVTDAKFLRFTDHASPPCDGWENIRIDPVGDARTFARRINVLPWERFEAEYSLWHDSTHQCAVDPWIPIIDTLRDFPMATYMHPWRSCLYDEGRILVENNLATRAEVYPQLLRYAREGYPHRRGMRCGTVMIRHHTPAVRQFCEHWWEEVEHGCKRGEVSLSYVEWKRAFPLGVLSGSPYQNRLFNVVPNPGWGTTNLVTA